MARLAVLVPCLACLVIRSAPAQVVDSLLPPAEELRRFQASFANRPTQFRFGAASRDGLIHRFVTAIQAGDSAGLARLLITRDEFGTLIYPSSEQAAPPYFQKPALVWFQLANASAKGLARLVARDAGKPLGFRSRQCPAKPVRQGRNSIWPGCQIRVASGDSIRSRRLFGSIVGRDGRFKFLSYATEY